MGSITTLGGPGNNRKIREAEVVRAKSGERGSILDVGDWDKILACRRLASIAGLTIGGDIDNALVISLLEAALFTMTLYSTILARSRTLANVVCFTTVEALDLASPRCFGRGGWGVDMLVSRDVRMNIFALLAKSAFPGVGEVFAYFT